MSIGKRVFYFVLGAVLMGLALMGVSFISPGFAWSVIGIGAAVFGLMMALYDILIDIPVIGYVINKIVTLIAVVYSAIFSEIAGQMFGYGAGYGFMAFTAICIIAFIIYVANEKKEFVA